MTGRFGGCTVELRVPDFFTLTRADTKK